MVNYCSKPSSLNHCPKAYFSMNCQSVLIKSILRMKIVLNRLIMAVLFESYVPFLVMQTD